MAVVFLVLIFVLLVDLGNHGVRVDDAVAVSHLHFYLFGDLIRVL